MKTFRLNKKILGIGLMIGAIFLIVLDIFLDLILGSQTIIFGPVQKLILALGISILLIGFYLISPKFLIRLYKTLSIVLFISGIFLLLINIYGETQTLRNPNVDQGIFTYGGIERTIKVPAEEVYSSLDQFTDESDRDYVYRLTQLIFDGTVHHWSGNPINEKDLESSIITEYNLRVPIYENFILWGKSYKSGIISTYEFCNPYLAIERGASVCSQSSKIVGRVLEINGYDIRLLTLKGHVITEVLMDGEWWVLDADFGLVIENDVSNLQNNTELVKNYYLEAGYSGNIANNIREVYGPEGNIIFQQTLWKTCEAEEYLYKLKWQVPLLALLPFTLNFIAKRINNLYKKKNG